MRGDGLMRHCASETTTKCGTGRRGVVSARVFSSFACGRCPRLLPDSPSPIICPSLNCTRLQAKAVMLESEVDEFSSQNKSLLLRVRCGDVLHHNNNNKTFPQPPPRHY